MMNIKPIARKNTLEPYFMLVKNIEYIPNAHREIEVTIVLSGEVIVTLENEQFQCQAGDIIFIHEYAIHSYNTPKESLILGCSFRKECSEETLKYINAHLQHSLIYHNSNSKDRILELADWIINTKNEATSIQKLAYLFFIFGYLQETGSILVKKQQHHQIIIDVLQYIDENIDKDINLDTLCFDLNVSKYYISHLFKEKMNYSIMNYFIKLKLAGAKRLLIESDHKISDIVISLGFSSIRTFNRLFVNNFGVTPTQFREDNSSYQSLDINPLLKKK